MVNKVNLSGTKPSDVGSNRYIPSPLEELTMIEAIRRLGIDVDRLEEMIYGLGNGSVEEIVQKLFDEYLQNGDLLEALRLIGIGEDSLELLGSLYLKNDNNLFGRLNDGRYANLATMQQNNLAQYGDMETDIIWLIAKRYLTIRGTMNPTFQLVDDNGINVGSGRTLLHQGNSCSHSITFASGTQILHEGVKNKFNILTNVNTIFPPESNVSVNGDGAYKINRTGMYAFDVVMKLTSGSPNNQYIRVDVEINKGGNITYSTQEDILYVPSAYSTPFISCSFMAKYSKDDIVSIAITPLKEDITVGNGTKVLIYQLGDTITI